MGRYSVANSASAIGILITLTLLVAKYWRMIEPRLAQLIQS